jgi:hypothetical protein
VLVHPDVKENVTSQTKFESSRDQKHTALSFRKSKDADIECWPLQYIRQAELIMDMFPYPVFLETHLELGVVEGDKFAITKIVVIAMTKDGHIPRRFKSQQEPKKQGVTFLHILSELQGTRSFFRMCSKVLSTNGV